jgi:hypothetical protein
MLSNHRRRETATRFKSMLGISEKVAPEYTPVPRLLTLSLPASLPRADTISPSFWAWLNGAQATESDFVPPRVFSPAGEVVRVPEHLQPESVATYLREPREGLTRSNTSKSTAAVRGFRYSDLTIGTCI